MVDRLDFTNKLQVCPEFEKRTEEKTHDVYFFRNAVALVATDRLSDNSRQQLCYVPSKGVILNSISCWWMKAIAEADICPTSLLCGPLPEDLSVSIHRSGDDVGGK